MAHPEAEMKKTVLVFIVMASLFLTASLPSPKKDAYRILVEKSDKNIAYTANDFYSVYYVYMNVIQALDINDRLGASDIEKVISLIIDNLKKRNVVQLQVDNYKGGTLRVTVRSDISRKDEKPSVWIISNYNARTKRVVSGDDQKDAYGTFFYLIGDKLVKYQRIHEPKSDDELKKMTVNSRADYYLLDGDAENDAAGKDLLIGSIEKPGEASDRAMLYMTLSEYHLLSGNVSSAKQCLDSARAIIDRLKDERSKTSLSNILKYAADLYRYYTTYTGRS